MDNKNSKNNSKKSSNNNKIKTVKSKTLAEQKNN